MDTPTNQDQEAETPVPGSENGDSAAENPTSSSNSDTSSADAVPASSSGATEATPLDGTDVASVVTPSADPVPVVVPTLPSPFTDTLGITQVASDFAGYFAQKIVPFLDVIDVFDVNDRRKALHAIVKKEDDIFELFEYSRYIITLMADFAASIKDADLIVKVDTYFGKYGRMKQWVGI